MPGRSDHLYQLAVEVVGGGGGDEHRGIGPRPQTVTGRQVDELVLAGSSGHLVRFPLGRALDHDLFGLSDPSPVGNSG